MGTVLKDMAYQKPNFYIYLDYIEDPDSLLRIAPKLGSYVDLYEGVSMIAQIKLGQLGWAANTKRLFGKCNQIVIR